MPVINARGALMNFSNALSACRFERDGKRFQSSKCGVGSPFKLSGNERGIPQPTQKSGEGDLCFDARKRRSETVVSSPAECDMTIFGAADVQPIRIPKLFRIAVRGAQHGENSVALADGFAAEFRVSRREPASV